MPTKNDTPSLEIQLLGGFVLRYKGETVRTVNMPRVQSLLAYLLLHKDVPQLRQHLAFLFWPDSSEGGAVRNLRVLLTNLRRALPDAEQMILVDRHTVQWSSKVAIYLDVTEFQHLLAQSEQAEPDTAIQLLQRAAIVYQGELLPGYYDDWVWVTRQHLNDQNIQALDRLSQLLEKQRSYTEAIRYAQQLLRHDPLHEATYRRLMQLYAANDDRASAIRTYYTCVTQLERELGVEPHPATQAVYERLLNLVSPSSAQSISQKLNIDVETLRDKIERMRQDPSRGQMTISIPHNLNTFTLKQLDDLLVSICAATGINLEEIFLQSISSGSVRVTLELSQEDARKFMHTLDQNHPTLEPFSIKIEHQFQPKQQSNDFKKTVILCLAAEPSDTAWLQLGKEHREIFEALNRAIHGNHFMLQQIWAAKARDILRYLLYYRPAIVHFSGHGIENGALLFEDNNGSCYCVEPHTLSELFKGLKGDTHCVVLNSCYSHIQAEQIAYHIDCVVGIEGEIENIAAIAFVSAFYEAIASGRNVREAYILGQAELLIEHLSGSKQVRLISSENVNPNDVKFIIF